MQKILNGSDDMHWKIATAAGLAEGVLNRENYTLMATENIFQRIMGTPATKSQDEELKQFMNRIIAVAEDRSANVMERQAAVSVLGYLPPKFGFPLLEKLIHNPVESELHADAIYALTKQGLSQGCQILTSKSSWTSFTPSIRTLTLSLLISKPNYVNQLYQAIENGIIQTTEISSSDRQRLLNSQDKNISGRAKELFSELESGGRMQVYEMFKSLDKTGDAKMGKEVFIRTCSVCHSYAGTGGNVGPDLTGVKNQPADALLLHTLVPNYEVYPNYLAVIIETNAGDSFSGWIETESENSVTLRTSSGTQQSILRSNIKSLINTGKSLMPDGLEQTMTQDEMIDLISFLKSGG
ncbi:MAG: c-type cytochrome [Saprospiraceae bacterium]|nr:c-type cytochrome [Saprospiraceae bacterium]